MTRSDVDRWVVGRLPDVNLDIVRERVRSGPERETAFALALALAGLEAPGVDAGEEVAGAGERTSQFTNFA